MTKKKREDSNYLNQELKRYSTINLTEIKRIIKEHYEQLCAKKLGNLRETEKTFHKDRNKLTQKETENLNRHITRN